MEKQTKRTTYVVTSIAVRVAGASAGAGAAGIVVAVLAVFALFAGLFVTTSAVQIAQNNQCTVSAPITTGNAETRLQGSTHQEQAFHFYVNNGFTKGQAAGIVGNLSAESSSALDPKITNSIGAHGIAQWLGSRLAALQSFAASQKDPSLRDPDNFLTQLLFTLHELNGSFSVVKQQLNAQVTDRNRPTARVDVFTAADIWNRLYEISGSSSQPRANIGWQVYKLYGAGSGSNVTTGGTTSSVTDPNLPASSVSSCPGDPNTPGVPGAKTEAFVQAALSQVGKPYVFGAESPTVGFDCSGLTQWATARVGYTLPRLAHVQYRYGVAVDRAHLQRGDPVFWATNTSNPNTIYHVGIYLGGGKLLSAPHTGANVRVSTMYYSRGFIGGRRLFAESATAPTTSQGWQLPLPQGSYNLSSPYGLRFHPVLKVWKLHDGQDMAAPEGTPIYAASNGVVQRASMASGYGNFVVILHAGNIKTGYGHLVRFAPGIHPGVSVIRGQTIGFVGQTGLATGNHLHFMVWVNGHTVNPYIPGVSGRPPSGFMPQHGVSF